MVEDDKLAEGTRLKAIELLRQVRDPRAEALFLELFASAKSDALRGGLLGGLEAFDRDTIGEKILERYSTYSPAVKKRAIQTLLTRPEWARMLLERFADGRIPKA